MQAWEATLITVIKQEMLHLALSTNILTAVGAAPHFERPNHGDGASPSAWELVCDIRLMRCDHDLLGVCQRRA